MRGKAWIGLLAVAVSVLMALWPAQAQQNPPPPPPNAPGPPTLDARVEAAIRKGVEYLLSKQKDKEKTWEYTTEFHEHRYQGGETALVMYALLHVGESLDDPRLRWNSPELAPPLKYLTDLKPANNYTAAFKALALCLTPIRPDTRRELDECRVMIFRSSRPNGTFSYGPEEIAKGKEWDNSNAQYALLALWAIDDVGAEVPREFWAQANRYWRGGQQKDGGWPYDDRWRPNSNPPMNAAGLASLFVAIDQNLPGGTPPLVPRRDAQLDAALAKVIGEFNAGTNDYYYLYCVERVGLASGLKFFDKTNWYAEAAEQVVRAQKPDGSWQGRFIDGGIGGEEPVICTSYALLFLARGRNPVIFNKLQYGAKDSRWDARPRDNANLTRWMSKSFEKPLNWQVVNTKVSADEWLDAPILLITGSEDPKFTDEEIAKLKAFIEAGGTVFSSADGGDKTFTEAIAKKYAPAAMDRKYEMRDLPPTHELFDGTLWTKVATPPPMMGLSNGARDVWIHSTVDMGASWQQRRVATKEHFFVPANLQRYATGKGSLRNKLQTLLVTASPEPTTRKIALARLDYAGNADPEPGAWRRMVKLAQARFHTDLAVSAVKITDLDARKNPIAHLTGTGTFALTPEQIAALKKYLEDGGILFADSLGGSAKFTASFQELMTKLSPDNPLTPVPANDRLYNGSMAESVAINEAEYRKYTIATRGRSSTLRLQAINRNGTHSVIFSEDDITSGLLGTETWGVSGYTPECAIALTRNILLYVLNKDVPTTQATQPKPN